MKHFVVGVMSAAAVILLGIWLFFSVGIYIPSGQNEVMYLPFKTEGKVWELCNESGEYVPFTVRAVEVSSSVPGHYTAEFYPDEQDYLRWFEQIADMGGNTIKAVRIMDDDFYRAFYTYNESHERPLYLIQGIAVADEANNGPGNAHDENFKEEIKKDGKALVDIIHGRKVVLLEELSKGGSYRQDISRWVAGFLVGNDWNEDMIAYTDHSPLHTGEYKGTYFSTKEGATAFEAMLAQVMDEITAYETEKYQSQHPIGFINSPKCDFLRYDENYEIQLKKYSYLNAEHVKAEDKMKAGTFAAYHLYDYCDDFSACLSEEQKEQWKTILNRLDRSSSYGGYMDFLSRYHTIPVLAGSYGISSARGIVSDGQKPCTEEEQGKRLLQIYQDAVRFQWSGVCISSWQDSWELKSWNTAFATDMRRRNLWHNVQTDGQGYGLMAFEPEKGKQVCIVDGDPGEWDGKDEVLSKDGVSLSARYDWKGLYLLLKGPDVNPEKAWYIPMDLSPAVGSAACSQPALSFSREADFLLCIDGRENSRLLVQERYDAMRENFLFEMTGQNPFAVYPDKNSSKFVVVRMALRNRKLLENYRVLTPDERRTLTRLQTWETGRLTHGNGNPDGEDFCSLADFCFGNNCAEVLLPWALLNVADPTTMRIHKDYYENYGVELERLKQIWFGIAREGQEGDTGRMEAFPVKGTGRKPAYEERLKRSYHVIQEVWREERDESY